MNTQPVAPFADLGLVDAVVRAVKETGYEAPTPIQAAAIPPLLAGRDLLGQAQTGTGKTAAFALPLLSRLDLSRRQPQLLVLTPTRELAIQVAEAMQTYARYLPGFHVLPVYGGQGMDTQLRSLKRGVHAVVGTPGRVADHLRRGTLKLNGLKAVVLDEADEMLRMGFIDEVTGILDQTPADKQVALFSATMPPAISAIARSHLREPAEIRIASKTSTVATVSQHYWEVSVAHKLDALTRILEVEDFDAMLVFVRTRNSTTELAERLEARGYASAALNGDMPQLLRERTVEKLKSGAIDILVATDVAARGLDVERISHVLNYDVPHDTEAYVHRIGRTGRAGRSGSAVLFVTPRERRLLRAIEHATGQPIIHMRMPSSEDISDRRTQRFKQLITDTIAAQDLTFLSTVISDYQAEHNVAAADIAAALAWQVQREKPLRPTGSPAATTPPRKRDTRAAPSAPRPSPGASSAIPSPPPPKPRHEPKARPPRENPPAIVDDTPGESATAAAASALINRAIDSAPPAAVAEAAPAHDPSSGSQRPRRQGVKTGAEALLRYRIAVGRTHGAEPRHIVGAIANESGLDSEFIGRVHIEDTHSTVELPEGMPKVIFKHLKKVWVCGQQLNIEPDRSAGADMRPTAARARPGSGARERSSGPKFPKSAGFGNRGDAPRPAPRPKRKTGAGARDADVGERPAAPRGDDNEQAWPKDPSRSARAEVGSTDTPAAEGSSRAAKPPGFSHGVSSAAGKPAGYPGKSSAGVKPSTGGKPAAPYRGASAGAGKPGGRGARPSTGGNPSAPHRGSSSGAGKPGGSGGKPKAGGKKSAPFRGTSPSASKPGAPGRKPTLTRKGTVGPKAKPAGFKGKTAGARKSAPAKPRPPKPD